MNQNHIIILVRGGCVQEVYGNGEQVTIELIDCDGDDLEKRERADLIEAEKKAGKWHTLPY